MSDTKAGNIGSASHLGEKQVPRDAHFVYDYTRRRVPLPVISYLAVADTPLETAGADNPARKALDRLRDLIEPAVVAEEELNTESMEQLIRENLGKINTELNETETAEGSPKLMASLTMVIADARRAYIGHVGDSRVYLLHTGRLYDLTPSIQPGAQAPLEVQAASTEQDMDPLFPVPGSEIPEASGAQQPQAAAQAPGTYLGQEPQAAIGYNEVEITPGDTVILLTDGLISAVKEEELVENLLSAMNVQRSASQLVRLAFSRDPSDNATMAAWQYVVPGQEDLIAARDPRGAAKAVSREKTKTRAAESILVALLALVLVGIFAVGFAFGWRITDTFRKPAKQKARQAATAKETKRQSTVPSSQPAAQTSQPQSSAPASAPAAPVEHPATVNGQGVRMRTSPDPKADLVGLLKNGQVVTVLSETIGADGKGWSKVRGTVTSEGADKQGEGYVRSDLLTATQSGQPATTSPIN